MFTHTIEKQKTNQNWRIFDKKSVEDSNMTSK